MASLVVLWLLHSSVPGLTIAGPAPAVPLAARALGTTTASVATLETTASGSAAESTDECPIRFVDQTVPAGLSGFRHQSGARGEHHLPETMGAGVAWLDYDGDGWSDLYLVQSGAFPPISSSAKEASLASDGARLFRSLGVDANGEVRFEDKTGAAGLLQPRVPIYGQGVLAADFDNDGDPDLLLTGYRGITLLENRNAVFHQVEISSPTVAREWSTSAGAADANSDGRLDLYVARYLDYDPAADLLCGDEVDRVAAGIGGPGGGAQTASTQSPLEPGANGANTGHREACDPSLFEGQRDVFWLGEKSAGLTFKEATLDWGLQLGDGEVVGKGLGVLFVDLDEDARADLYVANDITPNHLFLNRGEEGFVDESLLSGAAVNQYGKAEAGMGLAVIDIEGDGDPDVAVTNFDVETNTLYRNDGGGFFQDVSTESGFGLPSFNQLGFGLLSADFDLDGFTDLYVANGHIFKQPKRPNVSYEQEDQVLRGSAGSGGRTGALKWIRCATEGLPKRVSRGAASADYDLDGDLDIVVTHVDEVPVLLESQTNVAVPTGLAGRRGVPKAAGLGGESWVGLALSGSVSNRDSVGAVVRLRAGSGPAHSEWVLASGSYLSSSARDLRFALGSRTEGNGSSPSPPDSSVERLEIRWPSGRRLVLASPPHGALLRVVEPGAPNLEVPNLEVPNVEAPNVEVSNVEVSDAKVSGRGVAGAGVADP